VSGRVVIFDTTLRDGEQSPGCSMNAGEKIRLARQLERLGADVIEAGFPIASQGEIDSVRAVAEEIRSVRVAALARAKDADIEAAAKALKGAARPLIHTFLATSAIHLKYKLKITAEEALRQAVDGVRLAKTFTPDVEFSAEDASRTDYGYLREVLQAVFEAGAVTLNVPDTVGYSLPHEYGEMVRKLATDIPGAIISVHCHNDLGLAVANSLAAVRAGARQVECTINGIGERAGNTSLEEFVMALRVRSDSYSLETGIESELLTPTSAMLSGVTGVWPQPNKAIVGRNAFAHEAGIHQHGVLKNPLTYEIMTPASVGVRETLMVLGKHSGKHAVESRLKALGISLSMEGVEEITTRVKELADRKKFVYDDDLFALASAEAEARPRLVRYQAVSGSDLMPTATVEIELDGERRVGSAAGKGLMDAAVKALEAAFGFEIELLELHTRAVTSGTDPLAEAIVRVRQGDVEAAGQAASADAVEAALRAYLSAAATARRSSQVAA
jgi:2-isopropylmalate synthase